MNVPSNVKLLSSSSPEVKYFLKINSFKTLSNPLSGVNICMLDSNNNAVLKRIEPIHNRFENGQTDIILYAPVLEDINAIICAPEEGSWGLESIQVSDAEGQQLAKFIYGEVVGGSWRNNLAAYITKFDISPEMKLQYDQDYKNMKEFIIKSTMQLTGVGTCVTFVALGEGKAAAFLIGGVLALMYAQMLQAEIDNFGKMPVIFNNSATRLTTLFIVSSSLIVLFKDLIATDNSYYLSAVLGFIMYKLSLLRI
jgi:hypothetical protein